MKPFTPATFAENIAAGSQAPSPKPLLPTDEIIHIPQGRGGRLMKAKEATALYTWGFSSCNIIAVIGTEKLVLIHADTLTDPDAIKDEILWVGEDSEVVFIFREKFRKALAEVLLPKLKRLLPEKKINVKKMDDAHDGVLVSFHMYSDSDLNPHVKKFPCSQHPQRLFRHEKEQTFLAVQKIEQLVGLNARIYTGKTLRKRFIIFNGNNWEAISEGELKIFDSHPATKEELNFFSAADSYFTLMHKLAGLAESLKGRIQYGEELKDIVMPIAFYLEGYLNNYNPLLLLKRNLLHLLDKKDDGSIFSIEKPVTREDNNVCEHLNVVLRKPQVMPEEVQNIFYAYREKAPENPFKKQLVEEFNTFYQHYQDRMIYQGIDELNLPVPLAAGSSAGAPHPVAVPVPIKEEPCCFWLYYTNSNKPEGVIFDNIKKKPLSLDSSQRPTGDNCFNTKSEAEEKLIQSLSGSSFPFKKSFIFQLRGTAIEIIDKYNNKSMCAADFIGYLSRKEDKAPPAEGKLQFRRS